jgi:hypothetical protein
MLGFVRAGFGRKTIWPSLGLVAAGFFLAALPPPAAAHPSAIQAAESGSGERAHPQGEVKGRVIDRTTKQPLTGVKVRLLGSERSETTDGQGVFLFRGLDVGPYALEASLLYFRPSVMPDVIVRSGRTTDVQVEMDLSVSADEVVVRGSVFQGREGGPSGASVFSGEEIRRLPGTMGDVNRILAGLPSVAKLGHQYNGLVVRGGSPSENGYFLDNIKVPNINHFPVQGSSDGLLSLFNVDLIKDIEFHPGGFSAVFGNTLSSVTDIRLREGSREDVDVQVDLNLGGVGGIVEGPLARERGSWLLSFRNSFLNVLRDIGILDSVVPEYRDFQGKAVYEMSPRHSLSFLLVHGAGRRSWNREEALDNWDDFYGDIASSQTLAGVNWRALWGAQGFSDTSLSYAANDLDYGFLKTSTMSPLFTKNASEKKWKVRNLTTLRFNPKHKTLFGFEVETFTSAFRDDYPVGHDLLGNTVPATAVRASLDGLKADAFIEHHWTPWKVLSLTAGLRGHSFSLNGDFTLSPSLTLSGHLSPRTTLSASVGVYRQNLPEVLLAQNPEFRGLRDLKSVHSNLAFDHAFSEDTRLSLALYRKEYRSFPLDRTQPNLFVFDEPVYRFFYFNHEQLESSGRALSYGLEFLLQKKLVKNLYGLIGASVYRSRYADCFGRWWNRIYDNRYNATVDLGYKPDERWEFSLRWTFAGGMPYTPFEEKASKEAGRGVFDAERVNKSRFPPFNSLHLRFDRRIHFLRSNLILYLSVWNVFDNRKPQMYLWNEASNSLTSQISMGRVPVFGLELEF